MFFHFSVKFDYVLIRIWKKEEHFAIILFCKQSKSEIRIEKFWFSKFDFIMLVQGLQGPRPEPIILISWSLWVSINSAWRDESFELGNRSVAPLFPEKNVSTSTTYLILVYCSDMCMGKNEVQSPSVKCCIIMYLSNMHT